MTPEALRAAARALRHRAPDVSGAFDDVVGWAGSDTWLGPAADRFTTDLGMIHLRLRSEAEELLGLADRLERRADHLEQVAKSKEHAAG